MDIDYSNFEIKLIKLRICGKWYFSIKMHGIEIISTPDALYGEKRSAIRGAKRAIKRIVETAAGDK